MNGATPISMQHSRAIPALRGGRIIAVAQVEYYNPKGELQVGLAGSR